MRVDYLEGPRHERYTQHWADLDSIRDWYVPIVKRNAHLSKHQDQILHWLETDWVAAVDLYNATNSLKETIYIEGVTSMQFEN